MSPGRINSRPDAAALDVIGIQHAVELLRRARCYLRQANAHRAAAYVARAEKSTRGALSHAQRRAFLAEREAAR